MIASPAIELWRFLDEAYDRLSFNVLDDAAFKAMVLARMIEPTLIAQTIRVLQQVDAPYQSLMTLFWRADIAVAGRLQPELFA